jgi:hypothetical protein
LTGRNAGLNLRSIEKRRRIGRRREKEQIMSESNGTVSTSQVQQVVGLWQKSWSDHVARVASLYEEVGKVEAKQVEQVTTAVDEMAKLTRETMSYAAQLAAEWRRLSLDATRRSTEMFMSPLGVDGFRSK